MWLDSCSYDDPTVLRQIQFVISKDEDLLGDLSDSEMESLIALIRSYVPKVPFTIRSAFERFGAALSNTANLPRKTPPEREISTLEGEILDYSLMEAKAILEMRSIVMRHPKKKTCLLPFGWGKRFSRFLGRFEAFIRTHSMNIFLIEIDPVTNLLFVRLSEFFMKEGYLTYQRLVDTHGKFEPPQDSLALEDPQYLELCEIQDPDRRSDIAGDKNVVALARGKLETFIKQNATGCPVTKARRCFSDSGILPLPLEWFDDICFTTDTVTVFLRKREVEVPSQTDQHVQDRVCRILEESWTKSASIFELSNQLCLQVCDVRRSLKGIPLVFYEPDMVFSCSYFEETVQGYVSSATKEAIRSAAEAASISPLRHLLRSVEAATIHSPDQRLGSEYVLAWCAALDVQPRMVWQCLQDKVFWSDSHSELQILLRTAAGMAAHPNPLPEGYLPRDRVMSIKHEIKKLGRLCTLDRLSGALKWSKSSDNRKKYGPLKEVLTRIPEVYYDPSVMVAIAALNGVVIWPDYLEGIDVVRIANKCEADFMNLAAINSTIIYYLSQPGCVAYPLKDAMSALINANLVEKHLFRLVHLFVPDEKVYLRDVPQGLVFSEGSVEEAVLSILRASPKRTVDMEKLLLLLNKGGRFATEQIDAVWDDLRTRCSDLTNNSFSNISYYCYYDPSSVILVAMARKYLLISLPEPKIPALSDFVPKSKYDDETVFDDDQDVTGNSELEESRPPWCRVGVIVRRGQHEYVIDAVEFGKCALLHSSAAEESILCPVTEIDPRPVRLTDKVMIVIGPLAGRSGHLVGISGVEGSVQLSKFEFRSVPLASLVPLRP